MDGRTTAISLLILALLLHLLEEIKTGFRKRLPTGEMPLRVFVGINAGIYAFCFATLVLSLRNDPWAVPFAWLFAVSMLLNGLGHVGVMLINRAYFPGGLTAFLLLLAAGHLMLQLRS